MISSEHSCAIEQLPSGVKACLAGVPERVGAEGLPTVASINEFRAAWSEFAKPHIAGPLADDVVIEDYPEHNSFHHNPLPIRIYRPLHTKAELKPVILCTSGGGFIANRLETNQTPWSNLAKTTGLPVITYQYTTAPEVPFIGERSRSLAEAEAITEWLFIHAAKMGFDVHNIFLAGDSSGGNFAIYQAYTAIKKGFLPKRLILISPVVDLSRTFYGFGGGSEEFARYEADEEVDKLLSAPLVNACYSLYAPDISTRNSPLVSPLYINDLAASLPPTEIIVASCDRLKRDAFALKQKLGALATLYVLPGTHAFLTARALFGSEPGPNPASLAASVIKLTLGQSFEGMLDGLAFFKPCSDPKLTPHSTFAPV